MPGWHEATKSLQAEGKLQLLGLIQEQHPDRARLFMQFKHMDWPLMVDSLNLLGVSVVPITLAIDERGVIRLVNPRPSDLEGFLAEPPPEGDADAKDPAPSRPDLAALRRDALGGDAAGWVRYADALILWGGRSQLDRAIEAYSRALATRPDHGPSHFRLGVAYRKRHDSAERREGDFTRAVEHWTRALEIDPNNYIWRRRIQQYGPRLDKPYPFYDWVAEAREAIEARGEKPRPLVVEPRGAELAGRARSFASDTTTRQEPDTRGKVARDERGFITTEVIRVPPVLAPGDAARVHVLFRPNTRIKAHWNNEAEDLLLWVSPPEGWQADHRALTVPNPPREVSLEERRVEFELKLPESASTGSVSVPAYALYYVCEDVDGACLYRRQDLELRFEVRESRP